MDHVKGRVTAVGASETFGVDRGLGTTVYDGIRIEPEGGEAFWLPRVVCAGRTSFLLESAMDDGEPVEIWLSGTPGCRLAYAISTLGEHYRDDAGQPFAAAMSGLRYLLFGLITLFFVVGAFLLPLAAYEFYRAYRLAPPSTRRQVPAEGAAGRALVARA